MSGQPAIEPVTDEDTRVAMQSYFINMKHILEQDRRRVAERQANHGTTHAEGCVSWGRGHYECAMVEIEHLRAEVARIEGLRVAAMEHLADYDVTVGKLQAEVATLRAERNTALRQLATHIDRSADDETVLRAEVARLSAACAAKDVKPEAP